MEAPPPSGHVATETPAVQAPQVGAWGCRQACPDDRSEQEGPFLRCFNAEDITPRSVTAAHRRKSKVLHFLQSSGRYASGT